MNPLRLKGFLLLLVMVPLTGCVPTAPVPPRQNLASSSPAAAPSPLPVRATYQTFRARVVASVPADRAGALGLELVGDLLVENTGATIRAVTPSTGDVRVEQAVPPDARGTGIALTPAGLWQTGAGAAVLRDPTTLAERRRATLAGESWGLCHDGTHLVQSDGTTRLLLRDRDTAAPVREVRVVSAEWSTARLGELHCVTVDEQPQAWAAVTGTDWMIRVDLTTGAVTAVADLTAVTVAEQPTAADQVIGGITGTGAPDELWLTGQHYDHRYRIRLQPQP